MKKLLITLLCFVPFLLQAQDDSTSVYFIAKITGAVTYAADDLTFRFHLQYR